MVQREVRSPKLAPVEGRRHTWLSAGPGRSANRFLCEWNELTTMHACVHNGKVSIPSPIQR